MKKFWTILSAVFFSTAYVAGFVPHDTFFNYQTGKFDYITPLRFNGVQVSSINLTGTGCAATISGDTVTLNCTGGGGGGGGSSSLEILAGGVQISSPTGTIIFTGPFKGFSPASSTSTIQIDSITANGVLIISSATSVYLSKLDAASLYATLTQLQSTSTDISNYKISVAVDSAAKYNESKASAAKESSDFAAISASTSNLFGFQTASAAKETNDMIAIAASTANAFTAIGSSAAKETNDISAVAASTANAFAAIGSSAAKESADFAAVTVSTNSLLKISSAAATYPPLSGGLLPNTYIDVSSITKSGPLIAGPNITITPGAGGTTIASSGGGSLPDNLGTHIATKTLDMQSNQIVNLASTTLNGPASSFTLQSTSPVNPILLFVGQSSFTVTTTTVRIGAPSGFSSNLFAVSTGTVNVFEVNGSSIEANVPFFEATVAITVPDYVFAKDYHILTLPELFEFVDFYHHLPHLDADADSAELKKGSLSALFQQTMKLQQSLEEAYIYILQQDKRIQKLERRCSKLK